MKNDQKKSLVEEEGRFSASQFESFLNVQYYFNIFSFTMFCPYHKQQGSVFALELAERVIRPMLIAKQLEASRQQMAGGMSAHPLVATQLSPGMKPIAPKTRPGSDPGTKNKYQ